MRRQRRRAICTFPPSTPNETSKVKIPTPSSTGRQRWGTIGLSSSPLLPVFGRVRVVLRWRRARFVLSLRPWALPGLRVVRHRLRTALVGPALVHVVVRRVVGRIVLGLMERVESFTVALVPTQVSSVRRRVRSVSRIARRGTRLFRRHLGRMIFTTGGASRYSGMGAEVAGLCGGCDGRASVILRGEVLAIPAGHVFMLALRGQRRGVFFSREGFFLRAGMRLDAALAAIERDMILVHYNGLRVDVGHAGDADVGDRAVVEERAAAPFAADKSDATVAESIVDATVKADVRPPISRV